MRAGRIMGSGWTLAGLLWRPMSYGHRPSPSASIRESTAFVRWAGSLPSSDRYSGEWRGSLYRRRCLSFPRLLPQPSALLLRPKPPPPVPPSPCSGSGTLPPSTPRLPSAAESLWPLLSTCGSPRTRPESTSRLPPWRVAPFMLRQGGWGKGCF